MLFVSCGSGCVSRQPAASPVGRVEAGGDRLAASERSADGDRSDGTTGETAPWARRSEASTGAGHLVAPLPDDAWPVRIPTATLHRSDRQIVLMSAETAPPQERSAIGPMGVGELYRVDVARIASAGNLERVRRERGFLEWLVFQTNLKCFVNCEVGVLGLDEAEAGGAGAGPADLIEISETSFAIYLPKGPPRGLVLQLTNLSGNTEWEKRVTEAFHRDGWAVLTSFVPDGWAFSDRLMLDRAAPPEEIGTLLAQALDDRLAEWAYGVEAVLEYMRAQHPAIPQTPLVGVGSSAGALSLPAVAARLVGRRGRAFDATVLIGGGVDGLSVLRDTALQSTPLRLRWADDKHPDARTWARIREAYLRSARLDGYATATYLRGAPVLLLHAAYDRIVSAECGDALWEILGRPERWTYQTGHLGLFIFWVPLEIDRIVRWVDDAVSPGPRDRDRRQPEGRAAQSHPAPATFAW